MEFIKLESHDCWIGHLGTSKKIHLVERIDEGLKSCPLWVYRFWHKNTWQYRIGFETTLASEIEFAKKMENG